MLGVDVGVGEISGIGGVGIEGVGVLERGVGVGARGVGVRVAVGHCARAEPLSTKQQIAKPVTRRRRTELDRANDLSHKLALAALAGVSTSDRASDIPGEELLGGLSLEG